MRTLFSMILVAAVLQVPSLASAQFSIGVNLPGVSIGVNLPVYPQFAPVPGYPVYYAPQVDTNLFFYDGLYWVYAGDNWYSSSWYNGPWDLVEPGYVPYFVLRVPVLYYRRPPAYFGQWNREEPPRWGEHWGGRWQEQHRDWDRWNRAQVPSRAPLPTYQRQYSGSRYPDANVQRRLQQQHYRYQPREVVDRRLLQRLPPGPQHQPPRVQPHQPQPQQQHQLQQHQLQQQQLQQQQLQQQQLQQRQLQQRQLQQRQLQQRQMQQRQRPQPQGPSMQRQNQRVMQKGPQGKGQPNRDRQQPAGPPN